LRVWMMRDIILPRNEGHNDFAKSLEMREESVAVLDRRILEFPLSGYASGIRIAANA
jgi:hypothetical protein